MSAGPMAAANDAGPPEGPAAAAADADDLAMRRALDAFLRNFLSAPGAEPDTGAALAASIPERSFRAEHRLRVRG